MSFSRNDYLMFERMIKAIEENTKALKNFKEDSKASEKATEFKASQNYEKWHQRVINRVITYKNMYDTPNDYAKVIQICWEEFKRINKRETFWEKCFE